MTQHNHGQQERMRNLLGAILDMADTFHHIARVRSLDVAGRDAGFEIMGEHELPTARLALFAHV